MAAAVLAVVVVVELEVEVVVNLAYVAVVDVVVGLL